MWGKVLAIAAEESSQESIGQISWPNNPNRARRWLQLLLTVSIQASISDQVDQNNDPFIVGAGLFSKS